MRHEVADLIDDADEEHDSFRVTCTSRQLLSRLADKWVTLVLCALMDGSTRHSALARRITGVSQKMLTQTLRNLERDGLVSRTVTPTVPLMVEYELTPLGRSLVGVFLQLKQWADVNMDEVAQARIAYDTRPKLQPTESDDDASIDSAKRHAVDQ